MMEWLWSKIRLVSIIPPASIYIISLLPQRQLNYDLIYKFTDLKTMNDQISFSSNRNTMQKFKVVLVGDQNVGKSSIIARYIKN